MGKPTNDLSMEIMSAMSSLNMKPDQYDSLDDDKYISETVNWVKHSMSHLQQAISLVNKAKEKVMWAEVEAIKKDTRQKKFIRGLQEEIRKLKHED